VAPDVAGDDWSGKEIGDLRVLVRISIENLWKK